MTSSFGWDKSISYSCSHQLQTGGSGGVHHKTQINTKQIRAYCKLDELSNTMLKNAMERLNISARAYDRILKVARTIADLENSLEINGNHIGEDLHDTIIRFTHCVV